MVLNTIQGSNVKATWKPSKIFNRMIKKSAEPNFNELVLNNLLKSSLK